MTVSADKGLTGLASSERVLRRTADHLAAQFDGLITPEVVGEVVFESHVALARRAVVTNHLAPLVERFSRERLTAIAQSRGLIVKTVPEILYVCVHNSGRSQLAAAITRHLAGERAHVRSAGSQPGGNLLPDVVAALAEAGIDVGHEFPKPLTDDVVRAADAVVTMGCGDACEFYPGKRYLDWTVDDPAELDLEGVRRVRDELHLRVEELLTELLADAPVAAPIAAPTP